MHSNALITAVLIAGNQRARVQRCLRGLLEQDIADQIRVVVYDRAHEPRRELPEFNSPNVIYEAVGPKTTLGQLQKRALLSVTTDVIAFVEEHVLVPPGWARESLRLHGKGYAVVTGFFVSGNSHRFRPRIAFEITYGGYVLSKQTGETTEIPGDNSSFIRAKLLPFADDLEMMLNSDTLLIRRLVDQGEKLYRADLEFRHWNEDRLSDTWTALRYWNQMYICNASAVEKWSRARRLMRLISVPLVPLVRVRKNYQQVKANGLDKKRFFADLPAVLFLHMGTAAGMAAGLLLGYQDCEYRFSDCETNADRSD